MRHPVDLSEPPILQATELDDTFAVTIAGLEEVAATPLTMTATTGKRQSLDSADIDVGPPGKRARFDSSSPSKPADTTSIARGSPTAEQLLSPEVTEKSDNHQTNSDYQQNPLASSKSATGEHPSDIGLLDKQHSEPLFEQTSDVRETQRPEKRKIIENWVSQSSTIDSGTHPIFLDAPPDFELGPLAQSADMPPLKRMPSQELASYGASGDDISDSLGSVDTKNNFYGNSSLPLLFEQNGIHLGDNQNDIDEEEMNYCKALLSVPADPPLGSPLDDENFPTFFDMCRNKSESWLTHNLYPHLFPSPELLSTKGFEACKNLISGCNDPWIRSSYLWRCPQPDWTAAYKWSNFSDEERRKLRIVTGADSPCLARDDMFFPFHTREAKCAKQPLEIAERQNAQSMSSAAEGYIDLFRKAGRLESLNGKVFGLSMSYDNTVFKIYAHYARITTQETKITVRKYQALVARVFWESDNGKNFRSPLAFVYNVYEQFSVRHLKWIKETIALLPDPATKPLPAMKNPDEAKENGEVFKKPRNSSNADLRREINILIAQLERQQEQMERQREQMERQREDGLKREAELRAQMESQRASSQRREDELIAQLKNITDLLSRLDR